MTTNAERRFELIIEIFLQFRESKIVYYLQIDIAIIISVENVRSQQISIST